MTSMRIPSFVLLPLLLLPPALAQTITGRVVSPALVPIANVAADAGSGNAGTSDALGIFTITNLQLNQTYTLEFTPAFNAPWAGRTATVTVTGAMNLGDVVIQPGFPVTGHVQNPAGLALVSCNLNVYDQAGVKQFTPRDGTDALGNFQLMLAAGTWDIRIVPPTGQLLVPKQYENVVVSGPIAYGNITLATAYLLTGSVVDQVSSLPVAGTKLKVYDSLTGERVYVPSDTVNAFGQFSLPVPYGMVQLDVEPPALNTHVGRQIFGTLVPGPVALGQVRLSNGVLLSGTVTVAGQPAANADIDVLLPDGKKVFTPHDTVAANGTFAVAVPTGTALRTRVEAPAGSQAYGTVTAAQTFATATNLGTIALATGVAVNGNVAGTGGAELGASLHFVDTTSNVEIVTTGSVTDANGNYLTYVPPGTYRIDTFTVEGSFRQKNSQVVTIGAPSTVNIALADKLARTTLTSLGVPAIPNASLLPINALLHSMVPGLQTILIDLAVELPNGTRLPILPGLPLTLIQFPLQVDWVWVPVPTIPAADVGRVLEMVITFRDVTGTVVLDEAKTPFVVQ